MAIQKYKPEITLQKTILCPTGVGHELRSALENGNVERSRVLISEMKSVVATKAGDKRKSASNL